MTCTFTVTLRERLVLLAIVLHAYVNSHEKQIGFPSALASDELLGLSEKLINARSDAAPAAAPEPEKMGGREVTAAMYAPPAKRDVWAAGLKPADKAKAESLTVELVKFERADLSDGTFRAKLGYAIPGLRSQRGLLAASLFGDEKLAELLRDRCGKPGPTLIYIIRKDKYVNVVGASL